MQCGVHNDREAVGMCVNCGTYICVICLNKEAGKFYCDSCVQLRIMPTSSSVPQSYYQQSQALLLVQDKNRVAYGLLSLCLGWSGVHKLYLGQEKKALIYILFSITFIPFFLSVFEGVKVLSMSDEDFLRRYGVVFKG